MARLRTLLVSEIGETGRTSTRDVLVLDDLTPDQLASIREGAVGTDDGPPIMAFGFPLDLPEAEEPDSDDDTADITDYNDLARGVARSLHIPTGRVTEHPINHDQNEG